MVNLKTATLAGGCFWCLDGVFELVKGIEKVVSGYTGGEIQNPTYEQVCSGTTGHAEVVQLSFNPAMVTFDQILGIFFSIHDPTTLNKQGGDIGTQYRSAIFYHDDTQKAAAQKAVEQISAEGIWENPIVTEIAKMEKFFPAEEYHQGYFSNNPSQGYCRAVVSPKVMKFRKKFNHLLKV